MTPTATLRTRHDRPEVVAAALRPDNTDEMSTRVEHDVGAHGDAGREDGDDRDAGSGVDRVGADRGGHVVTTIERDSAGGLRTTVDDYVANLTVAQRLTDTTTQS